MSQVDYTSGDKHVIEWRIKNFSRCAILEGEKLECPVSFAGSLLDTAWVFFIFPRGKLGSSPNFLCCSLKREADKVGPEKMLIEFEFSLVTSEGLKTFSKGGRRMFERGFIFGCPNFVTLEEIFTRKELLHDDTLKLRCELRLLRPKKQNSLKTIVSEFPTRNITKSMQLDNFQEISKQNPMVLIINGASEKELLLNVSMNRRGETFDDRMIVPMNRGETSENRIIAVVEENDEFPESYLHMAMIKNRWDQPLHVSCRIKLLNKKLETAIDREFRHLFTEINEKEEWVFPYFIDTSALGDDCIDNGKLHLDFTFTICDSQPVFVSSTEQLISRRDGSKKSSLGKDLLYMYQTKKFSDVALVVGDKTFQAHKSVLAARSPKFDQIFTNLRKEGASRENSIVEITDIDEDTMERMLKFIYAGELEDLDNERILLLYTAAQKYRISSLRLKCIGIFRENLLTLQTIYKILVVAEESRDLELKLVAKDHIFKHYGNVLITPEWQAFTNEHKELADEVVSYLRMQRPC